MAAGEAGFKNKLRIVYVDNGTAEARIRFAMSEEDVDQALKHLNDNVVPIPYMVRGEVIGYVTTPDDDTGWALQIRTHSIYQGDIAIRIFRHVKLKYNEKNVLIAESDIDDVGPHRISEFQRKGITFTIPNATPSKNPTVDTVTNAPDEPVKPKADIDKEQMLEWLRGQHKAHLIYGLGDRAESYLHVIGEIESGKFDAKQEE